MQASNARSRAARAEMSVEELLVRRATISLSELAAILNMDRSTVLRKERQGLLPKRRDIAGQRVYLSSDVRALLADAVAVDGPAPDRSRKSREIALARGASKREAA